jgi:hypothetical protein
MSLGSREQRELMQIEQRLQTFDLELAGMPSVFTQLTAQEEIPAESGQPSAPVKHGSFSRRLASSLDGVMSLAPGLSLQL